MAEFQYSVVSADFDGAKGADPAQVVAPQVHQHIVLTQLLFVLQQSGLQRRVLCGGLAPGAGAGQWVGKQLAVGELDQCFRRGTGDLNIVGRKVEHIGGGILPPQNLVGVKQAALHFGAQAVRQHHLENIALPDIALGFLHHCGVSSLVKLGGKVRLQPCFRRAGG